MDIKEEEKLRIPDSIDSKVIKGESTIEDENELMRQDIQKKLETGSTRIWQDVQTKVGLLVVGSDVSELTIDQFLKLLDVIHRYWQNKSTWRRNIKHFQMVK